MIRTVLSGRATDEELRRLADALRVNVRDLTPDMVGEPPTLLATTVARPSAPIALRIAPTAEHVGSEVVLLRG